VEYDDDAALVHIVASVGEKWDGRCELARTHTLAFDAAESIISVARSRCSSSTVRLVFSYINNGARVKKWY
jgi:hypothetical protein